MDAKLFMKEYTRMCNTCHDTTNGYCDMCPAEKNCILDIKHNEMMHDALVDAVEKWSEENPLRTREKIFREIFPNAEVFKICPALVEGGSCFSEYVCSKCKEMYWNEEVKEDV